MKNKLKKLLITSLSTVCLLANSQANAMEQQEGSKGSSLQKSQLVLQLSEMLTEEQLAQLILNISQGDLSRNSLGSSVLSFSGWSAETELEKIFINREGEKLSPLVAPLEIFHVINDVLLPKYRGVWDSRYGTKTKLDLPEEEKKEVKTFLAINGKDIDVIGDPKLLLTFLMLLDPLPTVGTPMMHYGMPHPHQLHASQVCAWLTPRGYYGHSPKSINLFLQHCGGVKKGQFLTVFEEFYNHLSRSIDTVGNWYQPTQTQEELGSRERLRQEIIEALNKIFNVGGHQLFNIEKDGKVLDYQIPQWFNIVRQLAHFELREWKRKSPLLEQVISHFNAAYSALEEKDGKFYSGLATAPYTVSLIRTVEKNSVDRSTLKEFLEEEYKTHELKIEQYKVVKPHLSTLEKTVNWLDDIFKFVSKHGRVT